MSIKSQILEYLQQGNTLTGLQGLTLFKTMNLRNRISELRQEGFNIQDRTILLENGKRVSEYWLTDEPPRTEQEQAIADNNLAQETIINKKAYEKNGQFAFLP